MSRAKGNLAEEIGAAFLLDLGFEILDRNVYSPWGEVDIIAFKESVVHFVEVKSGERFEPIYNITPTKLGRIVKTAHFYLKKAKLTRHPFCIDALIVRGGKVELLENITL